MRKAHRLQKQYTQQLREPASRNKPQEVKTRYACDELVALLQITHLP